MIPIKKIYAVEVSGACNLERTCTWCPMNQRPRFRPRGVMDETTVVNALKWVEKLGTGDVLALHVFGEPLLHPKFDEIAARFGRLVPITMSTNGVLLDSRWADRLARVPWKWISVSPWDPKAQAAAIEMLHARGIPTMSPPGATHDWAGQSKDGAKDLLIEGGCPFLNEGKGVIRWDGTVATCCISDRYEDGLGNVNIHQPEDVKLRGYSICATCHLNSKG